MAKKNSPEYWESRIANNTWNTYNNLEERNRALLELYQDASKSIHNELYALGEKHSRNGILTLSEMYKQGRLETLNKRYQDIVGDLGQQLQSHATTNMQKGFREVYGNVRKGLGAVDFAQPNRKLMDELLEKPWRGSDFSSRLWKNQKQLVGALNDQLLHGLQQGKTVTEIVIALNNIMGAGFNNAHRLIRTETMHYLNSAAMRGYMDSGIQYVQFWAAQDERTCPECAKYHGKIYPIDKAPILPLHPHCRCTFLPVLDPPAESFANSRKSGKIQTGEEITSKKQAINRLQSYGISFTDSKKYTIDEALMVDCVRWLDGFISNYEGFAQRNPVKLPAIKCMAPSKMKGAVGYYSFYPKTDRAIEIALNGQYHGDIKQFENYAKQCVESKWYPANATAHKTFIHEYGHYVAHSLSRVTNNPNFQHDIINECIKNLGDKGFSTYKDAGDYVSRYAASSEDELFAETFAEYFGGENPREFAKLFGRKIDKILKGV